MNRNLRQTFVALVAAVFPRGGSERLLAIFVSASLPAALLAAWYAGAAPPAPTESGDWSQEWLRLQAGLRLLLPMLAVAGLVGLAWERLFAVCRGRTPDAGWFMAAWLFVLLLPPATPLWLVALGMSFGALFGAHVFGGTGRYVASPAVVGALFLHFAYPSILAGALPWTTIAAYSAPATPGVPAYAFLVTCAAGAFTLVASGATSARTLLGALLGLTMAAALHDALSVFDHAVLGSFAFCWAFLLTDPSTQALTRAGRWLHGALFGVLLVLIRAADPAAPDGVLFAVLLAGLLVPLFDYIALSMLRLRRGATLELRS